VGEISAALKAAAKDEGVCVVLLAQLNRALESREDKRPGLSDLRESGDLEADADVVAFIHREHYYLEKNKSREGADERTVRMEETKNQAELILGKNRSGPCKSIDLFCNVGCSTMATRSKYDGEAMF
jgi:replicative DNA helicase